MRKFIVEEKEITDPKEISNNIKTFYGTLFRRNFSKYISTQTLSIEESDLKQNKRN